MARRKRRASKADKVSAATLRAIKARKLAFLREVSSLLSDALGFTVRVSLVPPKADLSPDMRRASRRPAAANRKSISESAAFLGRTFGAAFNDPLPGDLLGDDGQ